MNMLAMAKPREPAFENEDRRRGPDDRTNRIPGKTRKPAIRALNRPKKPSNRSLQPTMTRNPLAVPLPTRQYSLYAHSYQRSLDESRGAYRRQIGQENKEGKKARQGKGQG
jgi:hypothetical protein